MPIPQALRAALPPSDRAETALTAALNGHGCPELDLSRLAGALIQSPGHVVLGAPSSWTDAQLRWAYVVILRHFGRLNDRYGLLFDVVDQGLDHTLSNAPVSKTRAATGMHTDSSDTNYNPDLVALLCIHQGASGGKSLLANASDTLDRLRLCHPELEAVGRTAWPRDVVTPGVQGHLSAIQANAIPVFSEGERGLEFRYMRYWTERAMKKLGRSVPSELTALFDFLDQDMATHAFGFQLKRGDMLLANNRWMVHGREAFEDQEGAPRRCLVRAWVDGFVDSRCVPLSLRA
jgi:hypothetical protein